MSEIDEHVLRIADAVGVSPSTEASTKQIHAIWKITAVPVAEARLLVQIINQVQTCRRTRELIRRDLDSLVRARPELEVVRALCDRPDPVTA